MVGKAFCEGDILHDDSAMSTRNLVTNKGFGPQNDNSYAIMTIYFLSKVL
jgi:hypothetical protein